MPPKKKVFLDQCPGYQWLIDRSLVGFEPFSQLQPWFFQQEDELFFLNERWPDGPIISDLLSFARRQDCDDIACLSISNEGNIEVVLAQCWVGSSYEVIETYPTFWEWLKSIITDIQEWSTLPTQ